VIDLNWQVTTLIKPEIKLHQEIILKDIKIYYLLNSVFGGFGLAQKAGAVNNFGCLFLIFACATSAVVNTGFGFGTLRILLRTTIFFIVLGRCYHCSTIPFSSTGEICRFWTR
jgi:hypothetical protein